MQAKNLHNLSVNHQVHEKMNGGFVSN